MTTKEYFIAGLNHDLALELGDPSARINLESILINEVGHAESLDKVLRGLP